MIIRNGIDLVEVARIEKSMRNPRFMGRCFSAAERSLFAESARPAQRAAAHFAAKEAFAKALGTGVRGFRLQEVEVLRDELGAPILRLTGSAAEIAARSGLEFALSISHTADHAVAMVTAYSR